MQAGGAVNQTQPNVKIIKKKIEVFEIGQDAHIGYDAEDKPVFARASISFFYLYTGEVIDNNSCTQY